MAENQTKLNFWQWLGLILLVGGLGWYAYDHWIKPDETPAKPAAGQGTNAVVTAPGTPVTPVTPGSQPATTQPASQPASLPAR